MNGEMGSQRSDEDRYEYVAYLIVAVFLLLIFWFLAGPSLLDIPSRGDYDVVRGVTTQPLRTMLDEPPSLIMGGYRLKCVECHKLFPSLPETARRLTQHTDIVLDHGMNNRCFNCHAYDQRNRLALPGGQTVPFHEVARLCATCHGTTYRDWQRGMHGRTNGHWDPRYGEQVRLTCTQCHDPHQPAYKPMSLFPGPDTLRMGDPWAVEHVETEEVHNPLRLHFSDRHVPEPGEGEISDEAPPHPSAEESS